MPNKDGTGPNGTYKQCVPTEESARDKRGFSRRCFGRRCRMFPGISDKERSKLPRLQKENVKKAGTE